MKSKFIRNKFEVSKFFDYQIKIKVSDKKFLKNKQKLLINKSKSPFQSSMSYQKSTSLPSEEILERKNLISEKWKSVNDKIYQIVSSNEEETLPYYKLALQLMKQLNQAEEKNEDIYPDLNARKYFTTDFVPNMCKYLLLNRAYRLSECVKIHDALLIESVKFYNHRILKEDNLKLAEMMKNVFDMQKLYYKMNNQDENQTMPVKEFFMMFYTKFDGLFVFLKKFLKMIMKCVLKFVSF